MSFSDRHLKACWNYSFIRIILKLKPELSKTCIFISNMFQTSQILVLFSFSWKYRTKNNSHFSVYLSLSKTVPVLLWVKKLSKSAFKQDQDFACRPKGLKNCSHLILGICHFWLVGVLFKGLINIFISVLWKFTSCLEETFKVDCNQNQMVNVHSMLKFNPISSHTLKFSKKKNDRNQLQSVFYLTNLQNSTQANSMKDNNEWM